MKKNRSNFEFNFEKNSLLQQGFHLNETSHLNGNPVVEAKFFSFFTKLNPKSDLKFFIDNFFLDRFS